MTNKQYRDLVQSVVKACRLLELISQEQPVALSRLVDLSGYKKTTAARLAATLKATRMIDQDPASKMFFLTLKALKIGSRALHNLDVRRLGRPLIERFAAEQKVSILVSVLDENEVIYIDKIIASEAFRISMRIGQRSPVYCSASGKAFLAFLEARDREKILNTVTLEPMTKNTITSINELEKELELTRKRGFALDRMEMFDGVCSVAAVIVGPDQKVQAAISAPRMEKATSQDELYGLGEKLTGLAGEISRLISWEDDLTLVSNFGYDQG
ncbi:MAG: IclR family transcriptional regulator [Desulfohalobiaceae bacterium]|nr:IclR family transcriptional regulator [Desulfohalobiaceae bacterium]